MNIRLVCLGAVSFLCAGCANLAREAQRSDGFLDFVVAIAGRPRKDVVPVERFSGLAGEILTAHAEVDHRGGTYVSGILRNGFGYEGVFDAHVDVKVFGPNRLLITSLATDYSPRPIPNDYHGTPGRAWFSVRLPFVPTPGSSIEVSFHSEVPGCKKNVDPCESSSHPEKTGKWYEVSWRGGSERVFGRVILGFLNGRASTGGIGKPKLKIRLGSVARQD